MTTPFPSFFSRTGNGDANARYPTKCEPRDEDKRHRGFNRLLRKRSEESRSIPQPRFREPSSPKYPRQVENWTRSLSVSLNSRELCRSPLKDPFATEVSYKITMQGFLDGPRTKSFFLFTIFYHKQTLKLKSNTKYLEGGNYLFVIEEWKLIRNLIKLTQEEPMC